MEYEPLIRGTCPFCKKVIMNEAKTSYINDGMEFWVKFSDNSNAQFSTCKSCYENMTDDKLQQLIKRQIVNWGQEILAQLKWYYSKAIHLKIVRHSTTKDGISG